MVKAVCKSFAVSVLIASTFWCRATVIEVDPVVARYHFVGTSQLTAANYAQTRKVLNLPSSVEYRDLVLNRLAGQIAASITPAKGQSAGNAFRPLLDDLLANESAGLFGVPGASPEEFVVAVHLDKMRASAWAKAIEKFAGGPNAIRLQQEGDWTVVSRGSSLKSAQDKFLSEIRKNHRPVAAIKNAILEANVDWPRLGEIPAIASFPFKPAVLQIKVSPKGTHLRTEVHAHYPQPIAWKSQTWKLPTETIRDPLVSFTAGQDAAAFMKSSTLAEQIGENPFTNQFFLWANVNIPFQLGALFPMKNAQRHLQSLGRELPTKFNDELKSTYDGQLKWLEKTNELIWQGVPILAPFVRSIHEKAGEFLFIGTFAKVTGPPAPQEMWSQFKSRSDLVYYDWESAGQRLLAWRMLTPLLPIFPMKRTIDDTVHSRGKTNTVDHSPTAVVDRWLTGVSTELTPTKENPERGNVVTEITRNSASDFTVVRSSQIGFTGVEIFMLTHWLAGTHPAELRRPGTPVPDVKDQGLIRKPLK